jgi:hypothetical protein
MRGDFVDVVELSEREAAALVRRFRRPGRRELVVTAWVSLAAAWVEGWHLTARELARECFCGKSTASALLLDLDLIGVIELKADGHGYRVLRVPPAAWVPAGVDGDGG